MLCCMMQTKKMFDKWMTNSVESLEQLSPMVKLWKMEHVQLECIEENSRSVDFSDCRIKINLRSFKEVHLDPSVGEYFVNFTTKILDFV